MATKTTPAVPAIEPELVPLKRICAEAGIDPKVARRKLRKLKLDFHNLKDRWTFKPDSAELKRVRQALGLDKVQEQAQAA